MRWTTRLARATFSIGVALDLVTTAASCAGSASGKDLVDADAGEGSACSRLVVVDGIGTHIGDLAGIDAYGPLILESKTGKVIPATWSGCVGLSGRFQFDDDGNNCTGDSAVMSSLQGRLPPPGRDFFFNLIASKWYRVDPKKKIQNGGNRVLVLEGALQVGVRSAACEPGSDGSGYEWRPVDLPEMPTGWTGPLSIVLAP